MSCEAERQVEHAVEQDERRNKNATLQPWFGGDIRGIAAQSACDAEAENEEQREKAPGQRDKPEDGFVMIERDRFRELVRRERVGGRQNHERVAKERDSRHVLLLQESEKVGGTVCALIQPRQVGLTFFGL
jgi:hypothetical protein